MNIHIMPVKLFLRLDLSNTSAAIISTSTDIDCDRIPCPYALQNIWTWITTPHRGPFLQNKLLHLLISSRA